MYSSISEDHGIGVLSDQDLKIYSVGMSTGGIAEVRIARSHPKCHIIATTIDSKGVLFETSAQLRISEKNRSF